MLKNPGPLGLHPQKPLVDDVSVVDVNNIKLASPPNYKLGEQVATRLAYGTALVKVCIFFLGYMYFEILGYKYMFLLYFLLQLAKNNSRVIALDGDTKNSTYAEKIKTVDPSRFIEGFIAEQNVVGVAIGAACRDRTVAFVSAFATFFTRAFDQVKIC